MLFRWLVLRGKAPLVKLLIWWKGDTLPLNHGLCWACQKWARRCRNERVVRAIERAIDGVGEPR